MYYCDFLVDFILGIQYKGKFLVLIEYGMMNFVKLLIGIDYLIELGVIYVYLFLFYDYVLVDEIKLDENKYNWGYDLQNYNVFDGLYVIDFYDLVVCICEFKQMVQVLYKVGIWVVFDVVYNYIYNIDGSNFECMVFGYFYCQKLDGLLVNGLVCGNEMVSNWFMMCKYMIEFVFYWIREYYIDGFCFDLMGIYDIEMMNEICKVVSVVDFFIIIYGEGWVVEVFQYLGDLLVMKVNICKMLGIVVFFDEMCDVLCGFFNDNYKGVFFVGIFGEEESIKFGIVGVVSYF